MSNSFIVLPGDITGKKIRTKVQTEDGNNVESIAIVLSDADGNIPGVYNEHLKTFELIDSIGHSTTNTDVTPECAVGKKTGIGTGAYTLLESHDFVQPSANAQMYLQSTGAQDTAAGTGVNEITIEYFSSAWGARKTVQVVPNGANQITVSVADIYRIHKIYGNKGHLASGDITLTNQAADVLYGQIDQYDTFMRRCIFYIAENEKVTVTQFLVGSTTSGGVNVSVFSTY